MKGGGCIYSLSQYNAIATAVTVFYLGPGHHRLGATDTPTQPSRLRERHHTDIPQVPAGPPVGRRRRGILHHLAVVSADLNQVRYPDVDDVQFEVQHLLDSGRVLLALEDGLHSHRREAATKQIPDRLCDLTQLARNILLLVLAVQLLLLL